MPALIRFAKPATAVAAVALLVGCSGLDGIGGSLLSGGGDAKALDTDTLLARPVCPPTEIRRGTETMLVFDPGKHGDPNFLRYQVSVQRVARECSLVGDNLVVRVGAAGRVAAGPKGAGGTVQVPVRIAAVGKDDQVLYSKLQTVTVEVKAPDFSALWTQVDDNVVLPANITSGVTIYVGVDETGGKAVPARPKKK